MRFAFPAQPRHDEPKFLECYVRRQCFLERLEPLEAETGANRLDACLFLGINPAWLKLQLSPFHKIGNHINNRAKLAAANLSDLLEGTPFRQQPDRFLRGSRPLLQNYSDTVAATKSR